MSDNSKSVLCATAVEEVLLDCFFRQEELVAGQPPDDCLVTVEGITRRFGLHKERVAGHRDQIRGFLLELPGELLEGMSFLNMCLDKNDHHWGEHRNVEQLVVLGCAAGFLQLCVTREFWPALPGQMPYYQGVL